MATKTKSKTATKKPAAHKPAKAGVAHKSTAKAKVEKRAKVETHAQPSGAHEIALAKKAVTPPAPASRRDLESVSLIDKKPQKKAVDGELKKKVLPPISRIRASLETPPVPKKVEAPPVKPEPVSAAANVDGTAAAQAEAEPQNVIHLKPPIIVKQLATELGLKNFQLIKELMTDFNVFVNQNQTIEPDIATKIGTELRNQYVLGYRPTNKAHNARWRKIKVKMRVPKGLPPLSVYAKTGYYAPNL